MTSAPEDRTSKEGARSAFFALPMTPFAPQPIRVDGPSHPGEEICHIVTNDDPDRALCGKDVTGWPWNPPWPICVVCADLAQVGGLV